MKGMIFAAGLGTRLKPFTLEHPKALVEVGGKPMLQHVAERMIAAGIDEIIINVHHFANQIVDFVTQNNMFSVKVVFSDESDCLLDTGGAIAKVAPIVGDDSLLVCNADIMTDVDIQGLIDAHTEFDADATLLVDKRDSSRQLFFDSDCNLLGWQNLATEETRPNGFTPNNAMNMFAFGGIHIVGPRLISALARFGDINRVFPVMPFYINSLLEFKIKSYRPTADYHWFDVGKPETLSKARAIFG